MASFQQVPDEVVLNHILCRLDTITRVRFAAVCRSWRALTRRAPPPTPCLLLVHRDGVVPSTISATSPLELSLFDPVSSTVHHLPHPGGETKLLGRGTVVGCHGAYLVYAPYFTLASFIYNPFSGETIQLPCAVRHPDGRSEPMGYLCRAQLLSNPFTGRPCLVAAHGATNFCICRLGVDDDQSSWTVLAPELEAIHDIVFHKGELYCMCRDQQGQDYILAYDLHHLHDYLNKKTATKYTSHKSYPVPRIVCMFDGEDKGGGDDDRRHDWERKVWYNLVESSTGELLLLIMTRFIHLTSCPPIDVFNLYRLEESALVQVEDLGGGLLFVGSGSAMLRPWGFGMEPPNGFLRKDCVYLVDFFDTYTHLGRFCIGEEGYKRQPLRLGASCSYQFIPSPALSCPWITPGWSSN